MARIERDAKRRGEKAKPRLNVVTAREGMVLTV